MRALVTGINGQDGSYLNELLAAAGVEVHGLVRAADVHATAPASVPFIRHVADLGDGAAVEDLVATIQPDYIVNLAAISSVGESWQDPVATTRINGLAVAHLLQAAWRLHEAGRPTRVIQASSAEIFGQASEVPQTEDTPLRPASPYGAAKAFAHQLVTVFRERGLFATNCVLYNHESPRRPTTFVTRKITRTVAAIARGEASELVLGNLDATRDWGWAPDYVRAMWLAAQAPAPSDYVIATGTTHTVRDFVSAAFDRAQITDWSGLVRVSPDYYRPVDPAIQRGDAARARRELGWSPSIGFADLVAAMVDHDLEHHDGVG